jgi:hypothetical protein
VIRSPFGALFQKICTQIKRICLLSLNDCDN